MHMYADQLTQLIWEKPSRPNRNKNTMLKKRVIESQDARQVNNNGGEKAFIFRPTSLAIG